MKQRIFTLFICILTIFVLTSCTGYNGVMSPSLKDEVYLEGELMFGESYNDINENPFYNTLYQDTSYFSMDSFTASYSNLRRYIKNNQALNGDIIKTDELINYFNYDLETPEDGETFKVTSEMSVAPWNEDHHIITIGVATEEAKYIESKGNNIVFLIDVSGSMSDQNKLPLLKQAFLLLLDKLNPTDKVSIVTYASGVTIKADGIQASKKDKLERIISNLRASGSTNGQDGIQKAYDVAQEYFVEDGINRVVLATDGDFNVGISNQTDLKEFIQDKAASGIYLSVLGFGMGNYKDTTVETLAKYGNGLYAYVDTLEEAKKVLVDDFNKTMITVAKDVKNKVTFNPELVESYRLIGYENKTISQEDFENEEADAGDLGSGHQTLVTYEVVLKEHITDAILDVFNLQINYKDPKTNESKTFVYTAREDSFSEEVSEDHKFVLCLVEFSLILRNSVYRGTANYTDLINRLVYLDCLKDKEKFEFYELVYLALDKDLVECPYYEQSSERYSYVVTIYTQFGCLNARYIHNSEINYKTIMLNLFGKVPTEKKFNIYLDGNLTTELESLKVTKDMELYVVAIE